MSKIIYDKLTYFNFGQPDQKISKTKTVEDYNASRFKWLTKMAELKYIKSLKIEV